MTSDFVSCLLCDILNGMPHPGGILIDNERFFAVHAPPRACGRFVLVLAPKRHMMQPRQLRRGDLPYLADIQQALDAALRTLAPDARVRVEPVTPESFGHRSWIVFSDDGDATPRAERLAAVAEGVVRVWATEVEFALDDARLRRYGGRLPPPAPLPAAPVDGPGPSGLLRVDVRFCRHCGAGVKRADYANNACPACAQPVR